MLIHNAVLTGSLTLPTSLPITGSLLVSGSLGIGMTPSRALDVTGTFRVITPNRSFFVTTNAYSISDGTLSSGIGMDSAGLYLGNVASSTGWTIANPQLFISAAGTSSFSGNLQVTGSTSFGGDINLMGGAEINSTGRILMDAGAGNGFLFRTDNVGVNAMIITSTGVVGIGTTTPKTYSSLTSQGQFICFNNIGIDVGQSYRFNNYYNSGTGTDRTISTGYAGSIGFDNSGAGFTFNVSSTSVTADNNVTTPEKMRFSSKGYLKVTSTGTYNDTGADNHEFINGTINNNSFFVANTNTSYAGATLVRINCNRTTTNASYNLIGATNGNSTGEFLVRDSGNVQNTNNSYTGTSDIKLKQDIIDASSQWEDIKQIRIRKFRFKKQVEQDENAPYLLGVIAQELELISPNLVDEALDFDGADEEVTSTTKSVKYSIIYMKAVKALQEAMAKIETLETTIETLTTRITALEN